MRKNIASQVVAAQMISKTDGSDVTSGTTTVYVTGDGGSQASGGGTVTHEGQGCWSYVPTQAETNYNHIAFTFVNTSAVSQTVNVYTISYDPHDTVRLGLTALPNAAAAASGGLPTVDANNAVKLQSGTGANQISLSSGLVTLAGVTHTGAVIPTVTTLTGHTAQTGDSYARLGAPAGVSIAADVAAVKAETASIQTDTNDIQTRIPAALVSGRMDSSVGAVASGAITAAAIATGAVDADALATDAVAEIADGVWDEAIAGHLGVGSTGEKLNAAGSAGDPWTTAVPGAYGTGTAGYILGTNLDAQVSAGSGLDAAGVRAAVGLATANLDTQLSTITNRVIKIKKNTALNNFPVVMVDETDLKTVETGKTVTAERAIDNGSFAACSNSVTEVGGGLYRIGLSAADLDGDVIVLRFTATGCATVINHLVTQD